MLFIRFKWNPKNHSQYKYKRRVAFCYWWCCCCVVGWVGNEDENSSAPSSREENNIFIIFQQLQTHTYETVSFPTLSIRFSLSMYCRIHPGCFCSLSRAWVMYKCHSLFLEFYPHAPYVHSKKKHKNLWKRWQHHPIFSVFMAHFNPHSFFSLLLLILLRMYTFFAASCLFVATRL